MPLQLFKETPQPQHPLSGIKNIIAIAAGKGGVGKSTITVNLGLALTELGYTVGIMDTDIYGPSIRKMLPETKPPQQVGERITPAVSYGMKTISMAYFRKDDEATVVRAPIANRMISQFIQYVDWGQLDFLLIDFPPGTGDIHLTLAQKANLNGAVMVTTPQEVAVLDVRKAINLFDQVKLPILGIIENMSYYRDRTTRQQHYLFGQGGGARLADEVNVPLLGTIPIDAVLSLYGDTGQSIFDQSQETQEVASVFIDLAEKLIQQTRNREGCQQRRMMKEQITITSLAKRDKDSFTITWSDGKTSGYRLSQLQQHCPCAKCVDKAGRQINPDVEAKRIEQVGRYAIRVQYSSGCSAGIYSYEMLYAMVEGE